jgi:hypothetical protein
MYGITNEAEVSTKCGVEIRISFASYAGGLGFNSRPEDVIS